MPPRVLPDYHPASPAPLKAPHGLRGQFIVVAASFNLAAVTLGWFSACQ